MFCVTLNPRRGQVKQLVFAMVYHRLQSSFTVKSLSVFIPASCMTSTDCENTGEMCNNGVCECLAGEKLVPGRCVRGKKS